MSGLPPLKGVENECCAAVLAIREVRVWRGTEHPSTRFGCHVCGDAYRWTPGVCWVKVSPLQDLKDMVAEDPRGRLEIEE